MRSFPSEVTILPSQLLRCSCCHAYVYQSPSSTQFCSPVGMDDMDCILPSALNVSPLPARSRKISSSGKGTSLTWPVSQSAVGSQVVHGQHRAGSHFQRKAGSWCDMADMVISPGICRSASIDEDSISAVPEFLCRRSHEYRSAMGDPFILLFELRGRSLACGLNWKVEVDLGDHTQGTTDFCESMIGFLAPWRHSWNLPGTVFLILSDVPIHNCSLLCGGDAWGAEKSQMLPDCNRLQWRLVSNCSFVLVK